MRRSILLAVGTLWASVGCGADLTAPMPFEHVDGPAPALTFATGTIVVISSADAGPGSFRDALARASTDVNIGTIRLLWTLTPIVLASPLVYSGSQALRIEGGLTEVHGPSCAQCDALIMTVTTDVSLNLLTVRNAAGNGVAIRVGANATGTIDIELSDVKILGSGLHGLVVDDASSASSASDAKNVAAFGADSDAGISVTLRRSRFDASGRQGPGDFDGLRIDEGGLGGITLVADHVALGANGDDGLHLNESGPGDVALTATFAILGENGLMTGVNSADAIDIDEADAGSVFVTFDDVETNTNRGGGVDITESGGGDVVFRSFRLHPFDNEGAAVTIRESDRGNIDAEFRALTAKRTRTDGIVLIEEGPGDLLLLLDNAAVVNSGNAGVVLTERASGDLRAVMLPGSRIVDNAFGVIANEDGQGSGTFTRLGGQVRRNSIADYILDDVTHIPG